MCQHGREWENEEERLAGVWYKGNPGFVGTKRSVGLSYRFRRHALEDMEWWRLGPK